MIYKSVELAGVLNAASRRHMVFFPPLPLNQGSRLRNSTQITAFSQTLRLFDMLRYHFCEVSAPFHVQAVPSAFCQYPCHPFFFTAEAL